MVRMSDMGGINDIVDFISCDASLASRAMQTASGVTRDESDEMTLHHAISRLGTWNIQVMVFGGLLVQSVSLTFRQMLNLELKQTDREASAHIEPLTFHGRIAFEGEVEGWVYIGLSPKMIKIIAKDLLDITFENFDLNLSKDIMGEFANIITGNLQSNICDAGLNCNLGLPSGHSQPISYSKELGRGHRKTFIFKAEEEYINVELSIDPNANI